METVPIIKVVPVGYDSLGGHEIHVGKAYAGYRPYDGCDTEDVLELISEAFAGMLKERLGFNEFAED